MRKRSIRTPFFLFNPKSYLYGQELLDMAKIAEDLQETYPDISIFVTAPFTDLAQIAQVTNHVMVTAQHMDGIYPGRGMGHVLPESIVAAGARATFLNHAERQLTLDELVRAMERAEEFGLITIVCANSLKEARAIATLEPDILLCEPTDLIGTGKTSDESYIIRTNEAIKSISPHTLVMQAAGISTSEDVYRVIQLGADGTGCTSGITRAADPKQMFKDMVLAVERARKEVGV